MELLRKLLFPFSLIYALVVHVRNILYDVGVYRSQRFETPTVCIGNLSVGGTGKTPMAEFLISHLRDKYQLALLSRGYRRESQGFVLANPNSTVQTLGDEPYQIHSKFPEIAVAVDADRQNGIRMLQELVKPDIIVLDDAFQHRKVKYGFSLLLTAYDNLYVNDWYLPTGNLRDSKREARRADLIIVTKCPQNLNDSERKRIIQKLNPESRQRVLFSYLAYSSKFMGAAEVKENAGVKRDREVKEDAGVKRDREVRGDKEFKGDTEPNGSTGIKRDTVFKGATINFPLAYFKNKNLTLVTGIANPEPLVDYLEACGLTFEHLRFKDHHSFTENELGQLRQKPYLLTTEKDYVRLKGKVENLYYLPIKHQFLGEGGKVLEAYLDDFMKSNS